MLKFSPQNAKTRNLTKVPALQQYLDGKRKIYSLDLPSGKTCPGAKDCKSMAVKTPDGWRIKDGPDCQFRCFSATQEIVFPAVRKARQHNLDTLNSAGRSVRKILALLGDSLPSNAGVVRLHVGGDFYSLPYFLAMANFTHANPKVLFYCYTKSLTYLTAIDTIDLSKGIIYPNFLATGSYGGKFDHLIPNLMIRTARVVYSESAANGLPIDHNDSHAATPGSHFALYLHGTQPAGTTASKALQVLRKAGKGSYAR